MLPYPAPSSVSSGQHGCSVYLPYTGARDPEHGIYCGWILIFLHCTLLHRVSFAHTGGVWEGELVRRAEQCNQINQLTCASVYDYVCRPITGSWIALTLMRYSFRLPYPFFLVYHQQCCTKRYYSSSCLVRRTARNLYSSTFRRNGVEGSRIWDSLASTLGQFSLLRLTDMACQVYISKTPTEASLVKMSGYQVKMSWTEIKKKKWDGTIYLTTRTWVKYCSWFYWLQMCYLYLLQIRRVKPTQ